MSRLVKSIENKIIQTITCPICRNKEATVMYTYFYDDTSSDILECSRCGHRWIHPVPLVEGIKRAEYGFYWRRGAF